MTGISIRRISEQVLAMSALHYLTSGDRRGLLNPDSRKAIEMAVASAAEETTALLSQAIKRMECEGEILSVEFKEGADEKLMKSVTESMIEHLTLARVYSVSHPEASEKHRKAAAELRGRASATMNEGQGVVKDGR